MKSLLDLWRNSQSSAPCYLAVHGFDSTASQGTIESWALNKRHLIRSLKRSGKYVIVKATPIEDVTV